MKFKKCTSLSVVAAAFCMSGCTSPPTPIATAPLPTPTSLPVVPLPTPKPEPTMTPRQKRAQRRAERKKERAERRRIAKEKAAEKKRLASDQGARESTEETPTRSVLEQLDWKYKENSSQILAMSDKGSEILAEAGLTESPSSIMEQVNKVLNKPLLADNGDNNQSYAEYMALYITLRKGR